MSQGRLVDRWSCAPIVALILLAPAARAHGDVVDLVFANGFQPPAVCGNGVDEAGEVCDDGNVANGDACNSTCSLTNTVTLFVGQPGTPGSMDGGPAVATLSAVGGLLVVGSSMFQADRVSHVIRKIDIPTRTVQTIAGTVGVAGNVDHAVGLSASFSAPDTIASDGTRLWIGDYVNGLIREMSLTPPYPVTRVAGPGTGPYSDGTGDTARMPSILGMTYHGGFVYFVDGTAATVRRFDPISRAVVTVAGTPFVTGHDNGIGSAARFISPRATVVAGAFLYIADTNGNEIRAYEVATGMVTTFAGDGTCGYLDGIGTAARVHRPRGVTTDGESLYWAEYNAHTIRQAVIATASVTTLAGTPPACAVTCSCPIPPQPGGYVEGIGSAAAFDGPWWTTHDPATRSLFVLDSGNFVIRRIQ